MSETTDHEHVKKHVRVYIIVFAALAALTIVTVAIAYLELSIVPAIMVALFIAIVKGSLVAGYFMPEKKVIISILIVTGVFLIGLFVLTISSYHDQDRSSLVP
jgi:caa(3)-type oxidase subunit IV